MGKKPFLFSPRRHKELFTPEKYRYGIKKEI